MDEIYRRDLGEWVPQLVRQDQVPGPQVAEGGHRPARPSSSRCPARSSAPAITPGSASSCVQAYGGRLPYIAAAGWASRPGAHVDDVAAGIARALARGEVGRDVRGRGRLHPSSARRSDRRREGRRAARCPGSGSRRAPARDGAVRRPRRAAEHARSGRRRPSGRDLLGVVAGGPRTSWATRRGTTATAIRDTVAKA